MGAGNQIRAGKAFVELGVQDKLASGLRAASAKLKAFGTTVSALGAAMTGLGAAVTGPALAASKVFAGMGDNLDKMSSRVGTSVEFLSRLNYAANLGGTSVAEMETGVRRMQRTAYDAAAGGKTASEAFEALGVNIQNSNGELKSTEELFMESAAAISAIENNTQKAALATIVFGRAGTKLLPMLKDGKAGLVGAMKAADELGITMSGKDATAAAVFTDQLYRVKEQLKAVMFQIGAAVGTSLGDFLEMTTRIVKKAIDWAKENRSLLTTVFAVASTVVGVGTAITAVGVAVLGLAAGFSGLAVAASAIGTAIPWILGIGAAIALTGGAVYQLRDKLLVLMEPLKKVWEYAKETFAGIADAISAGDIGLAMEVLSTTLQHVWAGALFAIKEKWLGLKESLIGIWQETVFSITNIWREMVKPIARVLARIMAWMEGLDGAQVLKTLESDFERKLQGDAAALQAARDKLKTDMAAERDSELGALQSRITALQGERQDALERARVAAEEAAAERAAANEEMIPQPVGAGLGAMMPQVVLSTGATEGLAAFSKFSQNREQMTKQMVDKLTSIDRTLREGSLVLAEAGD